MYVYIYIYNIYIYILINIYVYVPPFLSLSHTHTHSGEGAHSWRRTQTAPAEMAAARTRRTALHTPGTQFKLPWRKELSLFPWSTVMHTPSKASEPSSHFLEIDCFIDNLLVRIHFIIEMIWWTGLAPWRCTVQSSGFGLVLRFYSLGSRVPGLGCRV